MKILFFGAILLAVISVVALDSVMREMKDRKDLAGATPATTKTIGSVGGAFDLIDENGNAVTDQNYADKKKLVFFGFTSCPDVCPTELQRLADILDGLGAGADQVYPLFISIDPLRDPPEVMAAYTDLFHPAIIGLTGTEEQSDKAINSFKVYAAKVESEEFSDYMVNHSSYLYFMDENNQLITLFRPQQPIEEIVAGITPHLGG